MFAPRRNHRATLPPTGKVLKTGGHNSLEDKSGECPDFAELYDPVDGTIRQTGSLVQMGSCSNNAEAYTATLPDGKLLLTSHPKRV